MLARRDMLKIVVIAKAIIEKILTNLTNTLFKNFQLVLRIIPLMSGNPVVVFEPLLSLRTT